MKPYYEDDSVTIYNADCMEVMKSIVGTDHGVDMIFTSPPYNLSGDGNNSAGTYFRNLGTGYDVYPDSRTDGDYRHWQRMFLELAWDVIPNHGAIYYNHKPRVSGSRLWNPEAFIPYDIILRQIIVWDRGSGFNRQKTYYVPTYEWIFLIAKHDFRITTRSVNDVWRIPFETGHEHPAPFPLKLPTLAISTTAATTILDPFMGSGTTLRAAKDLGRKAIGIEISERYCEIAAKRMAQEVLPL